MAIAAEKIVKMNEKKEGKEYLLDPEEAGVKLDVPGEPTSKGWAVVTPEMWKFRFSVADKINVDEPAYYADLDAYIDMGPFFAVKKVYEESPNLPTAVLVASAFARILDEQHLKVRPYEMIVGLYAGEVAGIQGGLFCRLLQLATDPAGDR